MHDMVIQKVYDASEAGSIVFHVRTCDLFIGFTNFHTLLRFTQVKLIAK